MSSLSNSSPPKCFTQLTQILEGNGWTLDCISGSLHVFANQARKRCMPMVFHGGTISKKYASMILQQTSPNSSSGDICEDEMKPVDDPTPSIDVSGTTAKATKKPLEHEDEVVTKRNVDDEIQKDAMRKNLAEEFEAMQLKKQCDW